MSMLKIFIIYFSTYFLLSCAESTAKKSSDQGNILPSVSERPLSEDAALQIRLSAKAGERMLALKGNESVQKIIKSINDYVVELQDNSSSESDIWKDIALPLGTLWGEQLVKELQWEWASVEFDDNESSAIGVFSADRSLAIYPMHFVYGCLKNDASVKILLSYNMIKETANIPPFPSNSYENVMEKIHFIIPPG